MTALNATNVISKVRPWAFRNTTSQKDPFLPNICAPTVSKKIANPQGLRTPSSARLLEYCYNSPLTGGEHRFPRNTTAQSVSAQPKTPNVSKAQETANAISKVQETQTPIFKVQETTAVARIPESTAVTLLENKDDTLLETNKLALVVPTGKAVIPITSRFYTSDAPNQLTIRRRGRLDLYKKTSLVDYASDFKIMRFGVVGVKVWFNQRQFRPNYYLFRFTVNAPVQPSAEYLSNPQGLLTPSSSGLLGYGSNSIIEPPKNKAPKQNEEICNRKRKKNSI